MFPGNSWVMVGTGTVAHSAVAQAAVTCAMDWVTNEPLKPPPLSQFSRLLGFWTTAL